MSAPVDLFAGTGISAAEDYPIGQAEALDELDEISALVGRGTYLANWTADECVVPDQDGRDEAAEFDRFYPASPEGPAVLVDMLGGGSKVEVAQQEADKQVKLRRDWCEARGVEYIAHVDPLLRAFS
jgi:hypothetical protein